MLGQCLGCLELLHRAFKPRAIDLDPLTAQQHQVLGAGEQGRDFLVGERLAVQRHAHVEIEQPVEPDADGGRAPTVAVTCGRAGRLARQDAGMRTTTPALSSSGTL